jgi:hypothetical protein
MSRVAALALTALCGACGLVLGGELCGASAWFEYRTSDIAERAGGGLLDGPAPSPVAPSRLDLAAVLARPLFNWRRRPGPGAAAPSADETLPRLCGIVISPAGRYAIFAAAEGHTASIMQEGAKLGPFIIETITADHVDISSATGSRSLHPSFDAPPKPPPVRIPVDL